MSDFDSSFLAVLIISGFFTMNLVTGWNFFFKIHYLWYFPKSNFQIVSLLTIGPIILFNSFLFLYKKRYKAIYLAYYKEERINRLKGIIAVIGYFVISFTLLVLVAYFRKPIS
jgi:hypothetical protein